MELLSVIRRWHYRDHFLDPGRYRGAPGCSRNTVRKLTCARIARSRSSASPTGLEQAGPPRRPNCRTYCVRRWGSRASRSGRPANPSSSCTPDLPRGAGLWTVAFVQSRGGLRPRLWRAARQREQKTWPAVAFSCRWRSWPGEKRSSSTGRKTGRSSMASGPSCRWLLTSSSPCSRAFILRAYPQQTHEMGCSIAHNHALFRVLGGVPRRGHLRQYAHRRRQGRRRGGKERQVNARSSQPWSATSFVRGGVLGNPGVLRWEKVCRSSEERPGRAPSAPGSPCRASPR